MPPNKKVQEEIQYLIEQLNWMRAEAEKYSSRVESIARILQRDAELARVNWMKQRLQRYISTTEDLAGRLNQASSGIYWSDEKFDPVDPGE